ncbi:MAG: YncE family protein [Pseudonocardiaceae bacterium]
MTADGRHAYITNNGSSSMSVIETASNTVTTTVPVGKDPTQLAITADGRHAYILNYYSGSVSVIDT